MMQNEACGLLLLGFSLWCLGTWPALLRVCSYDEKRGVPCLAHKQDDVASVSSSASSSTGSFFRARHMSSLLQQTRGLRNICHVYMDFATAYFLLSSLPLLLTMILGNRTSNQDEAAAAGGSSSNHVGGRLWFGLNNDNDMSLGLMVVAMVGGSLLSVGNLSLQWATSMYGTSLAVTLAIQASLTVVLGTFINYALEPSKTNRPLWLVAGVLAFLLAIVLAALAQFWQASYLQREQHLSPSSSLPPTTTHTATKLELLPPPKRSKPTSSRNDASHGIQPSSSNDSTVSSSEDEWSLHQYHAALCGGDETQGEELCCNHQTQGGTPSTTTTTILEPTLSQNLSVLSAKEEERQEQQWRQTKKGMGVAIVGGLAFGFYSPAFNIAINDPFHWMDHEDDMDGALSVARTNIWFSLAFWITSMVGNVLLLHRDYHSSSALLPTHLRCDMDSSSSSFAFILWRYLTTESLADRQLAIMAGFVCAVGNVLQFQAGTMVGYAAADLVQAYPLVSTLWDVFLFQEFNHVDLCSKLGALLLAMYVAYLVGIALLAGSSVL